MSITSVAVGRRAGDRANVGQSGLLLAGQDPGVEREALASSAMKAPEFSASRTALVASARTTRPRASS